MTVDINEHFGVTVRVVQTRGPARAEGSIFLRSQMGGPWWHKVGGTGRVISAAQRRAVEAARVWVREKGDAVLRNHRIEPGRE